MTTVHFDLADVEYRVNPWPFYARLRDEAPVLHLPQATWDGHDIYLISRYEDVNAALRDKKHYSSQIRQEDYLNLPMLVNRDAPEHTRLRHMANQAFHARLVQTLGDWVQVIIDDLLTQVMSQRRVDLVDAYTTALPLRVVGGMLGIPLDRKADLRRWSQAVMNSFAVAAGMDPDLAPGFFEDLIEFGNYMGDLARERQQGENPEDILGSLVRQHEAGTLTQEELVTMAWSFVAAGHETTMNLLGGGIHLLLTRPDLAETVAANPELTDAFIEEYLRMYPPTQWLLRRAKTDLCVQGVDIPEGALLHVLLGSANRDPRQYDEPETFDLHRPNKENHMAFGAGPHFCPGAALSRLLARRTFLSIQPFLGRLSLDPNDPPELRQRQGSYGLARFPVIIEGAQP
ncbi:MAG TPA: cytochrome P450 [Microlunatus sp.]|nr:cytochrome P450 [Microlunatus sp.]